MVVWLRIIPACPRDLLSLQQPVLYGVLSSSAYVVTYGVVFPILAAGILFVCKEVSQLTKLPRTGKIRNNAQPPNYVWRSRTGHQCSELFFWPGYWLDLLGDLRSKNLLKNIRVSSRSSEHGDQTLPSRAID